MSLPDRGEAPPAAASYCLLQEAEGCLTQRLRPPGQPGAPAHDRKLRLGLLLEHKDWAKVPEQTVHEHVGERPARDQHGNPLRLGGAADIGLERGLSSHSKSHHEHVARVAGRKSHASRGVSFQDGWAPGTRPGFAEDATVFPFRPAAKTLLVP
jgi:hypothetical protein